MKKLLHVIDVIIIGCIVAIIIGLFMAFHAEMMALKVTGFVMSIFFAIFCFAYLYKKLFKETDIIYQLKSADKGNVFRREITQIQKYCESLELHKSQFMDYTGNVDSMKESYEIIYDKIYADIKYILDYIKHYDYISMSDKTAVTNRVGEMNQLIKKLNELDALYVELDNSTGSHDVQRVDDLLEALREITK